MSDNKKDKKTPEGSTKKKRGFFFRLLRGLLVLFLLLLLAVAGTGYGIYRYLGDDLPKISSLSEYRPSVITVVYSDDNRKIGEFYKERRIVVPLSDIQRTLTEAFIAAEDARFYKHKGIDFISIVRAFFKNLEAGAIVQGGSTITQQVTKSFLLTPERSYKRKIREAILAYRIDKTFTKAEILYLYLNQIYLGHGAYGVEAAAENYFGKSSKDLNLAECAILAGLPQAPSRYSPFRHPERAKQRQIYVLNRMVAEGFITNMQATEAINTELDIKPRRNWYIEKVPIYTEHVRRYIENKYGPEMLYEEGLQVYTAVNIEMQKAARAEVGKGLRDLDQRQGYRGPLKKLKKEEIEAFSKAIDIQAMETSLEAEAVSEGVVIKVDDKKGEVLVRMGKEQGMIKIDTMRWARKPDPKIAFYSVKVKRPGQVLKVGDVIQVKTVGKNEETGLWDLLLDQKPVAEAALLCIAGGTGHVKVMVGGRDFMESQFNRAVQSRRQPGSAFKPVIYAAALDKGYTPATMIIDSPIVFKDAQMDFTWKPKNYGKKFYGPTLLRVALAKSRNVVTIKILQGIGVDYCIDYARRLGITSRISEDLSIALGSSGVSLLEMVNSYSVFANQGYLVQPVFIVKIVDRDGNVLEEAATVREKVLEKSTAYIMTNLLEGVVQNGTGRRVKALKRPVAGKTGTSNNLFDAWFVGYTPRYITGVWVGFDEEASLGKSEQGARTASPIWLGFMKAILKDKPVKVFQVPEGVVFAKIDAETGLLPIPESKETIFECFKEGTVPTEYTKKPDIVTEASDFYKLDM
ncbi:MAG: PBP1A family penicillin-binding protein [Deltaproteobacteria bacterium]|nr:PBP1A family penicillin-binding protein [Deltaproteobacteria bacterium]MBW2175541.1 PBP1A family penicillin-binding protein [Deltaproteobacteria bacterium]MBW2297175.1 PBP1A family penicillin-binding protein [Deltaproteobacteria bacterium]RLC19278.1 MAG: penicillin-binding protein [Deltaproteobacteria bacterium]